MIDKRYKVLVLTDHRNHGISNSLYPIVRQMLSNKKCHSIDIANRGVVENNGFFQKMDSSKLMVMPATADFKYAAENNILSDTDILTPTDYTSYDLVLLRLPRPVSDEFLHWIESIFEGIPIINRPSGIIKTSSKAYLLSFPEYCAPMKLVRSVDEVLEYASIHAVVLKPLREYGGRGLIRIWEDKLDDGLNRHSAKEYLPTIQNTLEEEGCLAMKFLKNVDQGDKRIIVVDDIIMASSLRLPAKDSWLCNVAQGGTSVESSIAPEEEEMIAHIAPFMKSEGILIYGVDTLVNDDGLRIISEINTLSVGGFENAQQQTGLPIIEKTIEKIFDQCNK
ncbi:MAG: glutathione synthase [Saprospiraceae bacterium]|jgi:glutathione synthase